jgi:hypothetical protein
MSNGRKLRFGAAPLVVLIGTAALVFAVKYRHVQAATMHPHSTGFTLITRQTIYTAGEEPLVRSIATRYVSATGAWRQVATLFNRDGSAAADIGFRIPNVGVFHLRGTTPMFLSPASPSLGNGFSGEMLRTSKDFNREDSIAGYRALVIRYAGPSAKLNSQNYTEDWIIPEFGPTIFKGISRSETTTDVMEPVQVIVGEPDGALVQGRLDSPVSFAQFEKKIAMAEKQGRQALAVALRGELAAARKAVAQFRNPTAP